VKIVITGSKGRVGGALVDFLRGACHEVIPLCREDVDLGCHSALRGALESLDYDAWVNPAALSSPDLCERDPALSQAINATAPALMADVCRARDKYLLHFSTDYVFSGKDPGKRTEQDPAEPINHYGRHKREGELAVLASGARATVLRVSWVYGAKVPAFVEQCLQRFASGESTHAIADKWSIPTAMPDLSAWVNFLLTAQPSGVLHGCHSGEPVSWHGIAMALREILPPASDCPIHATRLADAKHFAAARPIHTSMENQLLSSLLPCPIDDWREAMRRVIT
jgi:dTDP-4-dehydrorhamnose reductase